MAGFNATAFGKGFAQAFVEGLIDGLSQAANSLLASVDGQSLVDLIDRLDFNIRPGTLFNDRMTGGAGRDLMISGSGNDTVRGAGGFDIIFAGKGNDVIEGGTGSDVLSGGTGNDRFIFTQDALRAGDRDWIIDAGRGDRIDFDAAAESTFRIHGVALSALTADTDIPDMLVVGLTNIARFEGHLVIDLNGDGRYDADQDHRIVLPDATELRYDAAADWISIG